MDIKWKKKKKNETKIMEAYLDLLYMYSPGCSPPPSSSQKLHFMKMKYKYVPCLLLYYMIIYYYMYYILQADIYSFAVILWEMLTRESPYEGMSVFQVSLLLFYRSFFWNLPTSWYHFQAKLVVLQGIKGQIEWGFRNSAGATLPWSRSNANFVQ